VGLQGLVGFEITRLFALLVWPATVTSTSAFAHAVAGTVPVKVVGVDAVTLPATLPPPLSLKVTVLFAMIEENPRPVSVIELPGATLSNGDTAVSASGIGVADTTRGNSVPATGGSSRYA